MQNFQSQHQKRIEIIHFLYIHEFYNSEINLDEAFENYHFSKKELKKITTIKNNYQKYKIIILLNFDKKWNWNRIPPLERAILILGAFELTYLNKGIVINEMVNYAKDYLLNDKYKFINSILQKISDYYEYKKQQ